MGSSARSSVPDHVTQKVASLAELYARADASMTPHQRGIEAVTHRVGRPGAIYLVVAVALTWIAVNLVGLVWGRGAIDPPPFFWLQGALTFGGVLLTAMVLTTQIRQTRHAEERAKLDLQVNMLAEAKVAKLIALVEELRHDMPNVPDRVDAEADAMKQTVDPRRVLTALEETLESSERDADEE